MLELEHEFLCELRAELEQPPNIVGPTANGQRIIVYIKGGTVKGPKINGEVLPGGGDWVIVRPDGVMMLDVRALIRTDDGELIYVYYRGFSHRSPEIQQKLQSGEAVDPSEYYFRTTPIFETSSEKYNWLTRIVCVGVGAREPNGVRYRIYEIL